MEIEVGDQVRLVSCSKEQIAWGNNDDPNHLDLNATYVVESIDVHRYHTKISLRGIPGHYNSVCFEVV